MKFKKGQSGNPHGRPSGAKNKTGIAAKSAIEFAAEGLGGGKRLIEWAKADPLNERVFWSQIYTKLLPLQVQGDPDAPLIPQMVIVGTPKVIPDSNNKT